MEDYEKFVQHRLSQMRKREDEQNTPPPAASLIRFHGQSILPPLLSGEQREEMQQHRQAAMQAVTHKKLKNDSRMAYVQSILHSVQLRKTPTLEELLRESEINTKSSFCHNTGDAAVSQYNFSVETNDNPLISSPPVRNRNNSVFPPLMTSTVYGDFFTSDVTPQQIYHERCLIDKCQMGSQPSSPNGANRQSVSSGYVTSENVENTISVSGRIDLGSQCHGTILSDGVDMIVGFFLQNTSNTIAKMPDIISYPPIDGEELEKSGLESSFSNNCIEEKDMFCTSFQEESALCNPFPDKKTESCLEGTEGENSPPFTDLLDPDNDHSSDIIEVSVSEEPPFTLNSQHGPTTKLHIQHCPKEIETAVICKDEAEPSEEPYRLSLQALLKKSQEYRKRQRMLRNQAKSTKIKERTQEQPGARVGEQNLSDKENDELLYKRIVTTEAKKSKVRRGPFIPTLDLSAKKNGRITESEFIRKNKQLISEDTGDGKTVEMLTVEDDTTIKNKLKSLQEVRKETKRNGTAIQKQPVSTEKAPIRVGYQNIPAPYFCRSPIYCKSRGSIKNREVINTAENNGLNEEDKKDEETSLGHQNIHPMIASPVSPMIEGDLTNSLAKSSQHIDQLESSLSSLKTLIMDLESTVKENLVNHGQTDSNTQSESSCQGIQYSEPVRSDQSSQLCQSDSDYLEKQVRDDGDGGNTVYTDWAREYSFDTCNTVHEDTGLKPNLCDTGDVSLIVHGKGTERENNSEPRLVRTTTAQKSKEKSTSKELLTNSFTSRKQQLPARCILSVTQQLRIPQIFRKYSPETTVPCNVSVLSDTSNYPADKQNEITVEAHGSFSSPSLNQSYDVDTPSDLWLQDGSGFDLALKGRNAREKHLTPESGGEAQGEVSKVKRRLLMHATERTEGKSLNNSGWAGPVDSEVRPNSSTPNAAVWGYGGYGSQKDMQEQLKQVHAAQVRVLQDEHRRQQEELLQALAMRYHLLQSVSFPCSMSASRLGDTLTFSTPSQLSSPSSECYRPLLSATVKGFLTRRLLRTDKVAQLVRTIRDSLQFLDVFHQQSPTSRQDLVLQERVTLQLRAARYELHDIFFSLSARERMQLISWDRELERERELRRQAGHTAQPRGKTSLSAATQKSLERKRGLIIQKKASEKHQGVVTKTGHKTGFYAEQPLQTKRGQFRAKPHRHPKSTYSARPR